jgi:hypothetical protein
LGGNLAARSSADVRDLSVVVLSCDAYADLWPTFFSLFRRHWPDCPFPVLLGSNHRDSPEPSVETIKIGGDASWADSAHRVVGAVDTPYVLLLLEDFLLRSQVNSAAVTARFQELRRLEGGCLRLKPFPKPDLPLARFSAIGEIRPGAPYRCSLQAAIWRREIFLELLKPGETAWEMEIFGSRRSDSLDMGFYSTWHPVLDYVAGVTLGEWTPRGIAVCREQGIVPDLSNRRVTPAERNLKRIVGRAVTRGFNTIPWRTREKLLFAFRSTGLRRPRPMPGRSRTAKPLDGN